VISLSVTATPTVTIAMPVFNGGKYVDGALRSIRRQSFADFELLISDNASTDNTLSICERHAHQDSRIRIVRQRTNVGAVANFVATLNAARTEFFMWAACDDTWSERFVELCHSALLSNPLANFALPRSVVVSRLLPFWPMRPEGLPFIALDAPADRVRHFALMPFRTHKDNFVYSLWRRSFIAALVTDIAEALGKEYVIGGAANEYALCNSPGVYVPAAVLFKQYRYVAPGHPLYDAAVTTANFLKGRRSAPRVVNAHYTHDVYLENLEFLCRRAGLEPEMVRSLVDEVRRVRQ